MIVFVIAMESEAQPLLDAMKDLSVSEVHGRKILRGTLCSKQTAAVICGVGKTNAAAGAQYAIDCLGADKILNIGVAGGLNSNVEIGKIYCISRAVQYDFNLAQLNGTPVGTLNEYAEPYLNLALTPIYPARKLATGDRFNDSKTDFLLLTEALDADIRDMEGGAIAHVCNHANIPFYSFKAISDVAGAGSTTQQFALNLAMCARNLSAELENIFKAVDNG